MAKNYCDDCFYYRNTGAARYCAYMFITGKRRPCDPGDGCTAKVSRKVKRRKKKVAEDGQ